MKRWLVQLAILATIGLGLLVALDLQPWALLTIKNVGSTTLTIDRAFEGSNGPAIKGVLRPGQRRFGFFRLKSEAGMSVACHTLGPPAVSINGGYYVTWQPFILALDLNNCRFAARREIGLSMYSLR